MLKNLEKSRLCGDTQERTHYVVIVNILRDRCNRKEEV